MKASLATILLMIVAACACADVVTRIDDSGATGTVTRVDSAGNVVVDSRNSREVATTSIPAAEVLSVRFDVKMTPQESRKGDLIVTASGERFRVNIANGGTDPGTGSLRCDGALSLRGPNAIPFADLRAWVPHRDGASAEQVEKDVRELLALDNDRDVVVMTNDDRMTGVVEWMTPNEVQVSGKLGSTAVKRELIRGIAFSKTIKPWKDPARLLAEVYLADGSVLLGDIKGPEGVYRLKSALGSEWTAEAGQVVEVRFRGGKLAWLSELKPTKADVTPFFNHAWPWQKDRSVWGNPLTVGGVVFERGIGVHSRTELTYDLGGQFATFLADVCIDDETKGAGSAVYSVTGDGRPLVAPTEVNAKQKPQRVKVDVTGIRELKLLVDFGKNEDTGDHVDWLNARLIRK